MSAQWFADDNAVTDDNSDHTRQLSKDGIYIERRAISDRAAGFIQPHGDKGVHLGTDMVNQLIPYLKAGGKEELPRYKVRSHLLTHIHTQIRLHFVKGGRHSASALATSCCCAPETMAMEWYSLTPPR